MLRKKTTPIRKNRRAKQAKNSRVLHLKVTSPRIMFFQSLRVMKRMGRTFVILGIISVIIYFAYTAIYKHFNDNEEFAIKYIPVTDFAGNDTVVLSARRVWDLSKIDKQGTIFQVALEDVEERLRGRPEVIDVEVDRKLPDTISIKIKERIPVAWLSCRELGLAGRNPYGGILVDKHGVTFKSQKGFWDLAKTLPVIEVSVSSSGAFQLGKKLNHADAERALQLVMNFNVIGTQDWGMDRIVVENFYTLKVVCSDGVEAQFSMYEHDFQLRKFLLLREHAALQGRKIAWVDLRPKTNNPGQYVMADGSLRNQGLATPIAEPDHGMDASTRGILERDN